MDLILVRHGETDDNREGRLMSSTGGPSLNAAGRAQAHDLATALEAVLPFRLYTSPARRTRETAETISEALDVPHTIVRELAETDVGALEGLTDGEMRARYPEFVREWEKDPATTRSPGGETVEELQARAWRAVQRLHDAHADETVVAVSHCFTISTVVARALDMPLRHFRRVRLDLGAMVRIELTPGGAEIIATNETWHLRAARNARAVSSSTQDGWCVHERAQNRRLA